jgi:hypothetical protein
LRTTSYFQIRLVTFAAWASAPARAFPKAKIDPIRVIPLLVIQANNKDYWFNPANLWIQYRVRQQITEEARMGRPVGVTIIAVLFFLGAAFCVLGAIAMFAGGGFIATLISQQGGQGAGAGAGLFAGMGVIIGVVILVFGALYILIGWGLLKLKEWARIVTIVLAGLWALGSLFGLVGVLSHFGVFILFWIVVRVAIAGLIIWYLLQPDVKAAFQGQARPATA